MCSTPLIDSYPIRYLASVNLRLAQQCSVDDRHERWRAKACCRRLGPSAWRSRDRRARRWSSACRSPAGSADGHRASRGCSATSEHGPRHQLGDGQLGRVLQLAQPPCLHCRGHQAPRLSRRFRRPRQRPRVGGHPARTRTLPRHGDAGRHGPGRCPACGALSDAHQNTQTVRRTEQPRLVERNDPPTARRRPAP